MRKPNNDDGHRTPAVEPKTTPPAENVTNETDAEPSSAEETEIDRYIEQVRNLIPHPAEPGGNGNEDGS